MARYEARLLVNTPSLEQATVLAIAAQLGVTREFLKVDNTRIGMGIVTVQFSTMRDDAINSIRSLSRVQLVQPINV